MRYSSFGIFALFPLLCLTKNINRPKNADDDRDLPTFCARTYPLVSDIRRQDWSSAIRQTSKRMRFELDFGEAACLRSDLPYDNRSAVDFSSNRSSGEEENRTLSLLYVFQYTNFHQSHAITNRYTFGIPFLSSECICDCPGGERRCSPSSKYEKCRVDSETGSKNICRTTYHPNQDSTGCSNANEHSSVCCRVTAGPYQNWKFVAVDIGQPTAFGELSFRVYHNDKGRWTMATSQKFRVPFNKITQIELDQGSLSDFRVVSSRPFRDLPSNIYFYQDTADSSKAILRSGPELNRISEWSLSKLGWFRFNSTTADWRMDKTSVNLQKMLHVKVSNCKEQLYAESFDASFYVSDVGRRRFGDLADEDANSDTKIQAYLGTPVREKDVWIATASISEDVRQILVEHRDPPPAVLDFELNTSTNIINFIHHLSTLDDFRAEIRLDAWSNRFLQLTPINAKGTILGTVYENETRRIIRFSFSAYFRERNNAKKETFVSLPETIKENQYICLSPISNRADEKCRWAAYRETPILQIDTSSNNWVSKKGDCPSCNDDSVSWSNFLKYLNPGQWLNGISGVPESLAFAVEIGFYIFLVVLASAVLRRFVCPLIKWAFCSRSSSADNAKA